MEFFKLKDLEAGTMEIKKILWPTDFSGNSEKALPYVQSLTKLYDAQIHVLYVIQESAHNTTWYGDSGDKHMDELIKQDELIKHAELLKHSENSARHRLDQICEEYMGGCSLYAKHIAVGDPALEILKFIKEEKMELVVMATHGEKGHFQFGSVCEKVMKNSPVPVIAIPIFPDIAA